MIFAIRTAIFGLALFFYGGPQFDALRPAAIDPPLKNFYRQTSTLMTAMARDVGAMPSGVRSFAASINGPSSR